MDTVTLSTEVVNKLMTVVGSMPYTQVAGLIQEFQEDLQKHNQPAPGPANEPQLAAVGDE